MKRLLQFSLLAAVAFAPAMYAQTSAAAIPRTADGKPDFTGIYQWPTYLPGAERGHSSATTSTAKTLPRSNPAASRSSNRAPAIRGTMSLAISACPPGSRPECSPAMPCSGSRPRTT